MKRVIVYYSYTGHTKYIAEYIKEKLGCDLIELKPKEEYSKDYNKVVDEEQNNETAKHTRELLEYPDVSGYDEIILGSSVWWYSITPVVREFLLKTNLDGKVICPYATNAGWLGRTFKEIKELCPKAAVKNEMNIVFSEDYKVNDLVTNLEDIDRWIESL